MNISLICMNITYALRQRMDPGGRIPAVSVLHIYRQAEGSLPSVYYIPIAKRKALCRQYITYLSLRGRTPAVSVLHTFRQAGESPPSINFVLYRDSNVCNLQYRYSLEMRWVNNITQKL